MEPKYDVLLAIQDGPVIKPWVWEVQGFLREAGLGICQATSEPDCIRQVERRAVRAALLAADRVAGEELTLLRIIRSIDSELPCWLVLDQAAPRLLRAAFALRARSVVTHPVDVGALTCSVTRVVSTERRECW